MKKKRAKRAGGKRKAGGGRLPKSAVMLTVILRPKEGQDLLLEAELRALAAPTRREEGCLQYSLHRSADAPAAYLLHEIWASREDHTQHTKAPHFLRWDARKAPLLTSRDAAFWKRIL